ncbi:serine/threonine-protein kinase [Streptomyces sp. NPDC101150]|uniref:serine/threonine-protein kinase n=1 Tax=Streptomyces sp. NPDC101150 TaxID=3366114 RepID=UPI0037FF7E4B
MNLLTPDDPRAIGPYTLLGVLGEGGMGRVYLARSAGGRTVAVKVVRAEFARQDDFQQRFAREVDAARRVSGHWTAPVLDFDTSAATPWVATGYVPGPDLQTVVADDYGPLPEHSLRTLANRLALALGAIHDAGLVHRDLKPSNVLVTVDGPRVIDFGIARALHGASANDFRTRTGVVVGSPAFMSPEQARGLEVGPQSDVFSLGAVLAYAATGRPPFGSPSIGLYAQLLRVTEEEPDLEGVPEELLGLVRRCLEKEPEGRPTPTELVARTATGELRPWLPGEVLEQLGRHAAWLLDLDPQARTSGVPVATQPDVPVEAPTDARPDTQPDTPVDAYKEVQPDVSVVASVGTPTSGGRPPQPSAPPAQSRFKRARFLVAVAGVLALSVGVPIAANSWEGNGTDPGGSGGTNGGMDGSGEPTPATVAVPKIFLGAWEGVPLSDTRVRVEFKKDEQHRTVARSFFLAGTSLCVVNKEPKKASKGSVSLGNARSENAFGSGTCKFLPSYTLKTRRDGNLDFATDNGRYKAVLFKARAGEAPVPEKYLGQWVPKGAEKRPTAQVTIEQAKTGDVFVKGWDKSHRKRCTWKEILLFVNDSGLISRPVHRRGSADRCGMAPTGARGYALAGSGILSMGHAAQKWEFVRKPGA